MSAIHDLHTNKKYFLSLIEYTAGETGFDPYLVEKDYFCSLVLHWLSKHHENCLVFKGGTLLAKVHTGFYRLSEDLDFTIPLTSPTKRTQRSKTIAPIKKLVNEISGKIYNVNLMTELTGSNESRQYNAVLTYKSCLGLREGTILLEISLREPLSDAMVMGKINTLLLNPLTQKQIVESFHFPCLSKEEAYSEKIRASLARNRLAIRDFYDLDYAIKRNLINFNDLKFIELIKSKMMTENCIEFNIDTLNLLNRKITTELSPTLRNNDLDNFDLDSVIAILTRISNQLKLKNNLNNPR